MNETARAVLMADARMRRRQAGQLRVALAECEEERVDNRRRADRLEWQASECEAVCANPGADGRGDGVKT